MLLAGELPLGHEVALIVVAALFIAFALAASFLAPRWKPDFPGPNGLSVFVIAAILMFVLMVLTINFFG
jgi:NADH:ubiquinone oxidoreductase subunit 3 (subunit A)